MTFEGLIHKFCEETGRHDLCADFSAEDYSDRGAGYYLNAGLEMLDRRYFRFLGADTIYTTTLSEGGYSLSLPRARSINYIRFRSASADDTEFTKLKKKTRDEIQCIYKTEYAEVTPGTPIYYIRTGAKLEAPAGEGLYLRVDNLGTITENTEKWAFLTALVYFTDWDSDEDGIVDFADSGSDSDLFSNLGLAEDETFTVEFLLDAIRENDYFEVATGLQLVFSSDELIILPPTDEDIIVEAEGCFYSQPFSAPDDTNFWSTNHWFLLNLAAQFKHEISMRNKAGANELLLRINEELVELNMDEIDEEDIDAEFIQIEG